MATVNQYLGLVQTKLDVHWALKPSLSVDKKELESVKRLFTELAIESKGSEAPVAPK